MKLNTFSDSLNHFLKNLEVTQNSSTDLLKENVECLKKKLNSKDKLIKSLIDTKTAILDTIGKSKRNAGKRHWKIEPSRFWDQCNRKTNLITKTQYMLET